MMVIKMTFMDQAIAASSNLWNQAANESFLEQMGTNTLSKDLFLSYIIQDSLYLRDYLKVFGMAIYKSQDLKQIRMFNSVFHFVNENETDSRLNYLKDAGLTDEMIEHYPKKPACQNYCDFLMTTALNEDPAGILMAVMPCMLGYEAVFLQVLEKYPNILETYFGPLVADYVSQDYHQSCLDWINYCNELIEPMDEQRKATLIKIFIKASEHELYFWQMAGGKTYDIQ